MNINIPLQQLSKAEKLQLYAHCRMPVLNEKAIFSDGTENFRTPVEVTSNETTRVRIRTAKDNVDNVFLRYLDKRDVMKKIVSDEMFDYYEGIIPPTDKIIDYYFEINLGNLKCYYNQKGVTREPEHYYNYKITPNFKTPDWAKGAIMYQIYVDRFFNGDDSNDVETREYMYIGHESKKITDWYKYPASFGTHEFYGGDLKGVMDKLDYLSELGVEVLYLNPVFVSPSNHKYDTQDYDYIDPHFGVIINDGGEVLPEGVNSNTNATKYIQRVTNKENLEASNQLFIKLVEEIHKRGMKVILDGVFNHCGSFNKWLDKEKIYSTDQGYEKGAYICKDSPYNSFFHFYNKDEWPDNNHYDGWWGHDTLPKLNFEGSEKLYKYVLDIAKKWVSPPFNVDGWRLDVAADLGYSKEFNHHFWRDFRKAVKEANPNAIILAEHYGDPSDWLQGDQWDTVMNYDAFMEPVTWFLTGLEKHSDEFRGDLLGNHKAFFGAMMHNMSRFHTQSLLVAMNELSNHDHSRFLTRTNRKVGRTHTLGPEAASEGINMGVMREAVVIQMTWPGAPTIYYGDEAGLCGWTDPDNRRTYPWGREDKALIELHKKLILIHKSHTALRTGSIKFLYGEHSVVSYGRFNDKDKIIVVVNNSHEHKELNIPAWEIGINDGEIMKRIILTTEEGFTEEIENYEVREGKISINMPRHSSVILKA